ncbi:phosphotransferase family protein [Streptomyces sp. NPDC021020]|uniref:phosphotransferase family protein n=1 Tax=Streptomyces sp. NPDC021020 TaxID=3365109 RepID=UPI0037B69A85
MTEPPPAALAWAAETAGSAAPARVVRRLAGGTHAATHLLRTGRPDVEMVLRRFPPGDRAARYEARVLAVLDGLDGWAPRLLDADPDGRRFGEPAVLISRLPGRADITGPSAEAAATHLGRALARVHAVPAARLGPLRDGLAAAGDPARRTGPAAPVLAAHGHRLAAREQVLTHYDYWSGNVLWHEGALSGIVDWSGASRAPRGFDVGWCRLDLVLLHGPSAAAAFLTAYERASGETVPDMPLWDLFALANSHASVETWLPNYHDLARTDLTSADLRDRHTAWTHSCLAAHEAAS